MENRNRYLLPKFSFDSTLLQRVIDLLMVTKAFGRLKKEATLQQSFSNKAIIITAANKMEEIRLLS